MTVLMYPPNVITPLRHLTRLNAVKGQGNGHRLFSHPDATIHMTFHHRQYAGYLVVIITLNGSRRVTR